ncbi:hypothetical protein KKC59_01210, partial [bacterium]|nr:hypothetical protein [bacterium]
KMFRNIRFIGGFFAGLVLLFGITVSGVYAEGGILEKYDIDLEVTADTAFNSEYMWRGFKLDDDPVMQQGVYIAGYGFTASVWGNFDIDSDDALDSDEVDYALDYTYEFKKFSASAGITYYDFPGTDAFSREYYVGLGLKTLLSPTITFYRDFGKESSGGGNGIYTVVGVSHSFNIGDDGVALDLSAHVGYNHELFIEGEGEDAGIGAALSIPLSEKVKLIPNINYSVPFDDLKDSNDGNQDDEFYGGVKFEFSF